MQWLGLIFGVALFAAAVFYFLAGFFPESGVGQRMRTRLEVTAEVSSAGSGIPGMGNEADVSDTEADEMEEHLRGLGYIE